MEQKPSTTTSIRQAPQKPTIIVGEAHADPTSREIILGLLPKLNDLGYSFHNEYNKISLFR